MNNRDWMGFSRTAMAVAVAIVAAAPAFAQNTTASVGGQITGADGKPVAGATVVIVHVESGSTNTLTTDADGRYSARGLRAGGPYTITISKGGLTDKREDVFLVAGRDRIAERHAGRAAQTIVVTGRGVNERFNSGTMGSGTSIGSRDLAAYASIQRNLQDYARTDPRLARPTRSAAKSRPPARTRASTASPSTASPPTTPSAWRPTTCRRSSSRSPSTPSSRCRST